MKKFCEFLIENGGDVLGKTRANGRVPRSEDRLTGGLICICIFSLIALIVFVLIQCMSLKGGLTLVGVIAVVVGIWYVPAWLFYHVGKIGLACLETTAKLKQAAAI